MPKVSHAHRESRRDQILDAALECFARQGFQATSMSDIIDASGLSAGAIYSYFPGKRDLATAVARRAVAAQATVLGHGEGSRISSSPSEIIRRLGEGFTEHNIPPSIVLQLWGEAATSPTFFDIVSGVLAELRGGVTRSLIGWAIESRRTSPDEAARCTRSALWCQQAEWGSASEC